MTTSAFWEVTPPSPCCMEMGWQGQRTVRGIFSVRKGGGLDPGGPVEMEKRR